MAAQSIFFVLFCVICDAGEFQGCNNMLQASFSIQFGWLRVSPQTILQLNHTRVHNPQADSLNLPPHSLQWAIIVTSLVSGGGGARGSRWERNVASLLLSDAARRRSWAEPWASFKNLTLLLPTTRLFTALESPLAELWKYEPRTLCSTKVSFLF